MRDPGVGGAQPAAHEFDARRDGAAERLRCHLYVVRFRKHTTSCRVWLQYDLPGTRCKKKALFYFPFDIHNNGKCNVFDTLWLYVDTLQSHHVFKFLGGARIVFSNEFCGTFIV